MPTFFSLCNSLYNTQYLLIVERDPVFCRQYDPRPYWFLDWSILTEYYSDIILRIISTTCAHKIYKMTNSRICTMNPIVDYDSIAKSPGNFSPSSLYLCDQESREFKNSKSKINITRFFLFIFYYLIDFQNVLIHHKMGGLQQQENNS